MVVLQGATNHQLENDMLLGHNAEFAAHGQNARRGRHSITVRRSATAVDYYWENHSRRRVMSACIYSISGGVGRPSTAVRHL
jgi:hypothetical protein